MVILHNCREENYHSTGDVYVNTHCISTLLLVQKKGIFVKEYFGMSKQHKITKCYEATGLRCCVGVQKIPQKAKIKECHWKIWWLMNSSSKFSGRHTPQFLYNVQNEFFLLNEPLGFFQGCLLMDLIQIFFNFVQSSNHLNTKYQEHTMAINNSCII